MKQYLILAMRTPKFDAGVLAAHRAHLNALKARGILEASGPFTDKSGGAYLIRAESLEDARAVAFADPVHLTGASEITVREWNVTRVAVEA
jgi:uncharacterized protein YciI